MSAADEIRKLIADTEAALKSGDIDDMFRASGRLHVLRECLAIVERLCNRRHECL